jgi:polysaccharide biosynthesis/export protein
MPKWLMPKGLVGLVGLIRLTMRAMTAVMVTTACAVSLAGCAGSSGNVSAAAGGAGDAPAYNAEGAVSAAPPSSAFAPTAAGHSSAASQAADTLTAVARPGTSSYKIGPLDVLDVTVFKVPDLGKTLQVAEDGTVNYPLVGEVEAAGKTAKELEQTLVRKLGAKYLHDPQVTVLVKEYNSQRVTISGSIKSSGVYSIKGRTSLMQVVAMAGDIDSATDSGDVVVFRTLNGQREAARFDIDDVKAGKAEDPLVLPGDVIVVNTSATKQALSNVMKVLPIATAAAVFSGL